MKALKPGIAAIKYMLQSPSKSVGGLPTTHTMNQSASSKDVMKKKKKQNPFIMNNKAKA